jgi:hypothetical protein
VLWLRLEVLYVVSQDGLGQEDQAVLGIMQRWLNETAKIKTRAVRVLALCVGVLQVSCLYQRAEFAQLDYFRFVYDLWPESIVKWLA